MPLSFSVDTAASVSSFADQNALTSVGVSILFDEQIPSDTTVSAQTSSCLLLNFVFDGSWQMISSTGTGYQIQLAQSVSYPVLYYLQGETKWTRVNGQSLDNKILSACVSSAGFYQVFDSESGSAVPPATVSPAPASPTSALTLGAVYVFPNPSKAGNVPTLHVECEPADKISFRLYDVSGTLVYEGRIEEAPSLIGGKNVYEHVLPAKKFRSGTYHGVVTAEKSGHDPLRKKFSFAVVK